MDGKNVPVKLSDHIVEVLALQANDAVLIKFDTVESVVKVGEKTYVVGNEEVVEGLPSEVQGKAPEPAPQNPAAGQPQAPVVGGGAVNGQVAPAPSAPVDGGQPAAPAPTAPAEPVTPAPTEPTAPTTPDASAPVNQESNGDQTNATTVPSPAATAPGSDAGTVPADNAGGQSNSAPNAAATPTGAADGSASGQPGQV